MDIGKIDQTTKTGDKTPAERNAPTKKPTKETQEVAQRALSDRTAKNRRRRQRNCCIILTGAVMTAIAALYQPQAFTSLHARAIVPVHNGLSNAYNHGTTYLHSLELPQWNQVPGYSYITESRYSDLFSGISGQSSSFFYRIGNAISSFFGYNSNPIDEQGVRHGESFETTEDQKRTRVDEAQKSRENEQRAKIKATQRAKAEEVEQKAKARAAQKAPTRYKSKTKKPYK